MNADTVINRLKISLMAIPAVIVLILTAATVTRNSAYRDEITLWTDTMEKSPLKGRAFCALGDHYLALGSYLTAITYYREAIKRNFYFSNLYIDLANAYDRTGSIDRAKEAVKMGISLSESLGQKKPRYHLFLGELYYKELNLPEAMKEFMQALRMDPQNNYIYYQLGLVYRASGDYDEAIASLTRALALSHEDNEIGACKNALEEVAYLKKKKN